MNTSSLYIGTGDGTGTERHFSGRRSVAGFIQCDSKLSGAGAFRISIQGRLHSGMSWNEVEVITEQDTSANSTAGSTIKAITLFPSMQAVVTDSNLVTTIDLQIGEQ
jgi:hypothetical protein